MFKEARTQAIDLTGSYRDSGCLVIQPEELANLHLVRWAAMVRYGFIVRRASVSRCTLQQVVPQLFHGSGIALARRGQIYHWLRIVNANETAYFLLGIRRHCPGLVTVHG